MQTSKSILRDINLPNISAVISLPLAPLVNLIVTLEVDADALLIAPKMSTSFSWSAAVALDKPNLSLLLSIVAPPK